MKKFLVLFTILIIVLVGCSSRPITQDAVVHDWLYSLEPRTNGSLTVWTRYSDNSLWCTFNQQLQQELWNIFRTTDGEIFIRYQSINAGSPEAPNQINGGGCAFDGENIEGYAIREVWTPEEYFQQFR